MINTASNEDSLLLKIKGDNIADFSGCGIFNL